MKINLIPIYSFLHKKNQAVLKEDALFVDEINNYLMDEDLLIQENAKDAIFDIALIGSGGTEKLFLNRLKDLKEPLVILSTSRNNSLKKSLVVMARWTHLFPSRTQKLSTVVAKISARTK